MGVTTTTQAPAIRKPGLWVAFWRARAVTFPAVALVALASMLDTYTDLPFRWAMATAAAGVALLVVRRPGRFSEAKDGVGEWRQRRGKFRAEYHRDPEDYPLPGQVEGRFALGRMFPTMAIVWWDCWGVDGPHILYTGATNTGKSTAINALLHQAKACWGWRRLVIDGKPGNEYRWLTKADGDGAVIQYTDAKMVNEALTSLVAEMHDRYRLLTETTTVVKDRRGREREGGPLSWRKLPEAIRAEWPPLLLVIDEVATALTTKDHKEAVRELSQLGRSVGIHLVLAMQRPDAEYLPGFIKSQTGGRVMFGASFTDRLAMDMTIGEPAREHLQLVDAPVNGAKGRAVSADVGGMAAACWQADLLDDVALLPMADRGDDDPGAGRPWSSEGPPAGDGTGQPWSVGAAQEGAADPGRAPDNATSEPPDPAGLGPGARRAPGPPAAAEGPSGPVLRTPGRLARLVQHARQLGLFVPLARARLALTAWRLVAHPHVSPGARPRGLRASMASRLPDACISCGREGLPWDLEHTTPRWAGGADTPDNLARMCRACHRCKTRWEGRVRRWRDRWVGATSLAEHWPSYIWNGLAALVLAAWHGSVGGWGAAACLWAAAAVLAWVFRYQVLWACFMVLGILTSEARRAAGVVAARGHRVHSRGIDRLANLDNELESAGNDTTAAAARAQRKLWRGKANVRLQLLAAALVYLGGRALVWWARGRLGL